MSFSISIGGHVDDDSQAEGVEQTIIDDLVAVLKKHSDHVNYATGSFQYAGSVDLASLANPAQVPPADAGAPAAGSPDVGQPDPVPPVDPNAPVDPQVPPAGG